MENVSSKKIESIYMRLKVLPQFIEELDSTYTCEDSKYFLGFDKIDKLPSILNYINKLTLEESVLFSSYMESAEIVYAWMGITDDPIDNKNRVYTSEYSDGTFLWRSMHIYLVRKYKMDLPQDFKNHILSFKGEYSHLNELDQEKLQNLTKETESVLVTYY
jgi:hypothetical protein